MRTVIKLYGTPEEIRRSLEEMCAEFGDISVTEVRDEHK